jgi:hypothetical protein
MVAAVSPAAWSVVAGLLPSPLSGGCGLHREKERAPGVDKAQEIKGIRYERQRR